MYCIKCGAQLTEGSRFCNSCGVAMASATATHLQQPVQQRQSSGFGKFLKWAGIGFGGLVGLIIVLIIIGALIGDEQPEATTTGAAPQAALAPTATLAPAITVTAVELSELYGSNKVAAENLYTGKIAMITGEVGIIEQKGGSIELNLRGELFNGDVVCKLPSNAADSVLSLREGQIITVQGTIKGVPGVQNIVVQGCSIIP